MTHELVNGCCPSGMRSLASFRLGFEKDGLLPDTVDNGANDDTAMFFEGILQKPLLLLYRKGIFHS